MPLIVHLTSLLLQILLVCPKTDATITWTAPLPQRGPLNPAEIIKARTTILRLINGSSAVPLRWKFTLSGETFQQVSWRKDTIDIGRKSDSGVITLDQAFQGHFTISASDQATLIINKVTEADDAVFVCSVQTNKKTWADNIQVKVGVPASFTNVSSNQTVNEGSDLQLFCVASGLPDPNSNVTWVKDGAKNEVLHRGPSWNVININHTFTGTYHCTANNGFGKEVSHVFKVNVLFRSRVILEKEHYVDRDGNASLHCQVEGSPLPTISWIPCNPQENVCNRGLLNISRVQSERSNYTCTANNSLGEDSASTSLIIGGTNIYLTLIITGVECIEKNGQAVYDQVIWDELKAEVDRIFQSNDTYMYIDTEQLDVRCGSLHVDLVLKFNSVVAEDSVLSTFRGAVQNGKLGKLSVNASSIVGIPPVIKTTVTPPTTTPTSKSDQDSNLVLIVGLVVGGVVLVVIIVAVVLLCRKKKCCNCCAKGSKEVSDDEAAGPQKSGTSSGTGNNGYDDAGSAYAQPNRSSLPPTKTAEKKEKKPGKKGKDLQPAALPLYAQVDKTKKKPREPENTYDDANNQRKRRPGEVTYTAVDHSNQGASLPRDAANQTTRPPPYTETTYAVLV